MEQQIRDTMMRAFWDSLEQDVNNNHMEHVQALLNEIKGTLKSFVPNRRDIHQKIDDDITSPSWEVQEKLLIWIERFQSPQHDISTSALKKQLPLKITDFLKFYYNHLEIVKKEVYEARKKLANGENLFTPDPVSSSGNGVPDSLKTGRS